VTIEAGASIGARSWVQSGCYVGRDCVVGEECVLYPNVVLYERSRLGKRCLIHSGTVIGDDGFGYQRDETGHRKIRHVGHVEVGDDVEMGANVAIDRGTYGRTVIGAGTKIDNLVHVAHNVQVGERTLLIAQVGIAGSARVGADSIIAGQAGIADHAVLGPATIVVPQSAIPRRTKGGEVYAGSPAIPYKRWLAASAAFAFLPQLLDRVRAIEKKLGLKSTAPPKTDD
jgi:UDP-3-O-[3-hydroxymyristoyl] glucosamine N-acyltransferase